jgi:simple sugar transport system ATP-binding protein
MVGGELPSPETRESTVRPEVVLEVTGLTVRAPDGRAELDDVSLIIHAGEVLGIAGVEGNGQAELVEAIMGLRSATGTVRLGDRDLSDLDTRHRREAGIGFIPEDRQRQGLLLEAPLWENRILGHQTRPPNVTGPWIDRSGARADTERIVREYDVRTPSIDVTASALSGGNQQKLIVGREMSGEPVLLMAAHPTRGVDVGAQAQIWDALRSARADGLAVLLVSADLDELIGLSDTIAVILRGKLVGTADPRTVTPEELGSAMTGAGAADGGQQAQPDSGPGADPDLDAPLPGTPGPGLTGTGTTGTGDAAALGEESQ